MLQRVKSVQVTNSYYVFLGTSFPVSTTRDLLLYS
jgi:hypothetical protein